MNPRCLHCAIVAAIHIHFSRYGEKTPDGVAKLDVGDAIAALAEVTGEFVHMAPTRPQRRQIERLARDCLDAGLKAAATGKVQAVETAKLETEH